MCGGVWVRPVHCSLQVISTLRGGRSQSHESSIRGLGRSLYGADWGYLHPSELPGDLGALERMVPRCQFHHGGPKNKPASCQLDKENKMDCTEIHKYGSCQLSCFYSQEFLFPNFSTSVGFKLCRVREDFVGSPSRTQHYSAGTTYCVCVWVGGQLAC